MTEKTLTRTLLTEQAYLCLFVEREEDENWRRQYFVQTLLDLDKVVYQFPTTITLADFQGREKLYFLYPLQLDGEHWGAILLALKSEFPPPRLQLLLLRLITVSICQYCNQRRERYQMAHTLHQNMHKKLAQDMHDGLAQQLFFLSAQLYKIKQHVLSADQEQLKLQLDVMEQRLQGCHLEVRNYISDLRDGREICHIFDAIEQLIKRITIGTNIQFNLSARGRIVEENFEVLDTIYRFVEEAAANTLKHAHATTLDVEIEATSVQIKVCIRDNGIGFNVQNTKTDRYGIIGINERISDVGGILKIQSKPNEGTEITAIIPRKAVEKNG